MRQQLFTIQILLLFVATSFAQNNILADNASEKESVKTESEEVSTNNVMEPSKGEPEVFVSDENNVYFNKSQKVYLWVSSSADPNSKKYILEPEDLEAGYFKLDTEGKNTIRSPWAIDPSSGEYKTPKQEVIFDVYADGIAPVTQSRFNEAPKYYNEGNVYYGKGLKVELSSSDKVSGVKETNYSLNGEAYSSYNATIEVDNEYENAILYYAEDKVGNVEKPITKEFFVDVTAPETEHEFNGEIVNNIMSPNTTISLSSSDNLSGVSKIMYKIGDKAERRYTGPIAVSALPEGDMELRYYAIDNVKNTEELKSTASSDPNANGALSLFIDRSAPQVDIEITGDQFEGDYTFVSERTRFKLTSEDNKAGVEKMTYGINIGSRANDYSEPFSPSQKNGLQYVNYAAIDKVKNWTPRNTKTVYLDKTAPISTLSFVGRKFFNRDTLFITKNTKIKLGSYEVESGLQSINYTIDGANSLKYEDIFTCEEDGFHKVEYYSIDQVNNKEIVKTKEFVIDNSAPEIKYNFSIEPIGRKEIDGVTYNVYPSNTIIYLAATDNASGVNSISYRINNGEYKYKTVIGTFKPGTFNIDVKTTDVLKNEAIHTINFIIEK